MVLPAGVEPASCANPAPMTAYKTVALPLSYGSMVLYTGIEPVISGLRIQRIASNAYRASKRIIVLMPLSIGAVQELVSYILWLITY